MSNAKTAKPASVLCRLIVREKLFCVLAVLWFASPLVGCRNAIKFPASVATERSSFAFAFGLTACGACSLVLIAAAEISLSVVAAEETIAVKIDSFRALANRRGAKYPRSANPWESFHQNKLRLPLQRSV